MPAIRNGVLLLALCLALLTGCQSPDQQAQEDPPAIQKNADRARLLQQKQPFHVPLQEFAERWNAVSADMGSELVIHDPAAFRWRAGGRYTYAFRPGLRLRLTPGHDNTVSRVEVISSARTIAERYQMLSAWGQVYTMNHPETPPFEADALFHKLGVRPDADLTRLTSSPVEVEGVRYEIASQKNTLTFRASLS